VAMKLFNVWPKDGYTHPALIKAGRGFEQVASLSLDPQPLEKTWVVEDFEWNPDYKGLPRPDVSMASGLCLPASLAQSLFPDRRGLELLPIRVEGEEWLVVHTLGIVDGVVDPSSSDFLVMPVIEGFPERRVYKWLNLVHPQPLPGEFVRLRGSVYGPHVTEPFVERVKALGLKGLQFELIGHVIADPSQAVPRPAPPPEVAATGKRRRQPKLTAKPLPEGEREEIAEAGTAMRAGWGIKVGSSAEATLAAVQTQIQQLNPSWFQRSKEDQVDALLGLAAIFGELICSAHGWTWAELRQGRNLRWIAVLAPQGTHALALVPYLRQQIESAAPTTTLLFNMIGAASLPPAESGQVVSIG